MNSATGGGSGGDTDPPDTGPDTPGQMGQLADPVASVGSAREMDLLGRLVAAPVRASNEGGAPSPNHAGGTGEFQRAMQAQVERGIERAAYQAAASGAWAGSEAGTGAVTLRLNPANLGMLRVHLRMDGGGGGGGGGVRARFEASSARTRGILAESIDSLRGALEERGLRVDEVTVGELAGLPERDWGLPQVRGRDDQPADPARGSGAGFAESVAQGAFVQDAPPTPGGAGTGSSAEIDGVSANVGAALGLGERFATLSGAFASVFRVGSDGRIGVDALV